MQHANTFSPNNQTTLIEEAHWQKADNCHICNVQFSRIGKRRHHCRFCGNSVCDKHSMKRKQIEKDTRDLERICDQCDYNLKAQEVNLEIQEEIHKINQEIEEAKVVNDKLYIEYLNKSSNISQLESELNEAQRQHQLKEKSMKEQLDLENQRSEQARKQIEELKQELDESHRSEKVMGEECEQTEKELDELRKKAQILRERKEEMEAQLDNLTTKLKASLSIDQVQKTLCENCKKKLDNYYKGVIPSISEANESSFLTVEQRDSIYKRPPQGNRGSRQRYPADKKDCLIF